MGSPQAPTIGQIADLEKSRQLAIVGKPGLFPVQAGKATISLTLPRQGVALLVLGAP